MLWQMQACDDFRYYRGQEPGKLRLFRGAWPKCQRRSSPAADDDEDAAKTEHGRLRVLALFSWAFETTGSLEARNLLSCWPFRLSRCFATIGTGQGRHQYDVYSHAKNFPDSQPYAAQQSGRPPRFTPHYAIATYRHRLDIYCYFINFSTTAYVLRQDGAIERESWRLGLAADGKKRLDDTLLIKQAFSLPAAIPVLHTLP